MSAKQIIKDEIENENENEIENEIENLRAQWDPFHETQQKMWGELVNQNFEVNVEDGTLWDLFERNSVELVTKPLPTELISTHEHLISTYENDELFQFWCKLGNDLNLFEKYQEKTYLKEKKKMEGIKRNIIKENKKLEIIKNEIEKCEIRLKKEADLKKETDLIKKKNAELKKKKEKLVALAYEEKEELAEKEEKEKLMVVYDEKNFLKSLVNKPIIFTPLEIVDDDVNELNKLGESLNGV